MIGPFGYGLLGEQLPLFEDDFVWLLDAQHPAAGESMTIELLAHLSHANVSFMNSVQTGVDRLLDQLGIRPHVVLVAED